MVAASVLIAKVKQVAANQSANFACAQIYGAYDVRLAVGGVKHTAIGGDA